MSKILIEIATKNIVYRSTLNDPLNFGGPYGNPEVYQEITVPDNLDVMLIQYDGYHDEEHVFSINAQLLQNKRNNILYQLRKKRDIENKKIDILVNELTLQLRNNIEEIRNYRQYLLDITNEYKDENNNATENIDNVNIDTFIFKNINDFQIIPPSSQGE